MAYDRYDTTDERSRWQRDRSSGDGNRDWDRERGHRGDHQERGFFERAADEIGSWFGGNDDDRSRDRDRNRDHERGYGSDRHSGSFSRGREGGWGSQSSGGREREAGWDDKFRTSNRGGFSERDYSPSWRDEYGSNRGRESSYRPMTGDYGRSERDRSQEPYGRDDYRGSSRPGTSDRSDRSRHDDPHYHSWRNRQMESLDRDYDDYRREHQDRFESEFGSWREQRQQKRGLLGQVREHMDVVGSDDKHVGTVDRAAGDRLILTKSDPESGGAHHSISCSDIDRVEGDRVILSCSADQAKDRWRDESRSRALFEREDSGQAGPRALNRSFEGTYR